MTDTSFLDIHTDFDRIEKWNRLPEREKQKRMGIPPLNCLRLFTRAVFLERQREKNPAIEDQVNSQLVLLYEELLHRLQKSRSTYFRSVVLNNLGNAYRRLKSLNVVENILEAIRCYKAVLEVWTADVYPFGYAMAMWNLGIAYRNLPTSNGAANIESAIHCYHEALRIYSSNPASWEYANILNNLGVAYQCLQGPGEQEARLKSIACFEEVLRSFNARQNPLFYASIQNNMGNAYKDLPRDDDDTNLTKAIECYEKALIYRTPQVSPYDYSMTLHNMGLALSHLRRGNPNQNIKRAIESFQNALIFRNPVNYPLEYTNTISSLGFAYLHLKDEHHLANIENAIHCFTEVLKYRTAQNFPMDYAMAMSDLGTAYSLRLEYGAGTEVMDRAIECFNEALRFINIESTPAAYASTMINMGNVYIRCKFGDEEEKARKAIHYFTEAIRIFTPQTNPGEYAKAMSGISSAYARRFERFGNTEDLVESAKYQENIRQISSDPVYSQRYALSQVNLGNTYLLLEEGDRGENLEKAVSCFRKAISYFSPENDPLDYAHAQKGMGDAFLALNRFDKARICYEKALKFFTPETTPSDYARTLIGLGNVYSSAPEDEKKAVDAYQEAISLTNPETSPFDYVMAHAGLGHIFFYSKTGDRNENLLKAIEYYKSAALVFNPESAPRVSRVTERNLGNAYYQAGMLEPAFQCYQQAIRAGELIYQAGLSLDAKTTEAETNSGLYTWATHTGLACAQLNYEDAFMMLERGKTKTIGDKLKLNKIRPQGIPDDAWSEYHQAAEAVKNLQAGARDLTPSIDSVIDFQQYRETSKKTAADLHAAIRRVQQYAPLFFSEPDKEILASLFKDNETALVSFCVTQKGSIAFTVCKDNERLQIKGIPLPDFTEKDLQRLMIGDSNDGSVTGGWIGDYLDFISADDEDIEQALAHWQQSFDHTLQVIGDKLLNPVIATLDTIQKIIFLPSNELFLLPLHAVPLTGRNGALVCDIFDVSYAPSIQVLANCTAQAGQIHSSTLFVVDDPLENQYESTEEVKGILKIMGQDATVLPGKEAIKEKVICEIQKNAYLHFNCHGHYDWFQPKESGLFLADDELRLKDLLEGGVDLSATRLVTLSACETGLIDIRNGGGGEYVGLPAGFMLAGIPCIVSSLWSVPQEATQELMVNFYHYHIQDRLEPSKALREAQKQVRQQPGLEHPFFWAAFIVNGL